MKSPRGLDILKRLCPNIYKGGSNTRTCCSERQLVAFDSDMALPQQLLSRCPSCWENFLNLFCQITCGLNQADFMWPDMRSPYPPGYHYSPKGIPAATVLLSREYAEGFFNSCKDVSLPSARDKAISLFCGIKAKYCNAYKLLNYMGDPSNGRAPFRTTYIIEDNNVTMPDGTTLTPLSGVIRPCNASSNSSKSGKVCSCQDCAASCWPCSRTDLQPNPITQSDYFHSEFRPSIRRSQLVVSRPGNHSKTTHQLPPPRADVVNFTSLFELRYMHQVLDLQKNVTDIPVLYKGSTFTYKDICYHPTGPFSDACALESLLQYWQNLHFKLDEVVYDEYQLFVLADYLDHFLSCTAFHKDPIKNGEVMLVTGSNISCFAYREHDTNVYHRIWDPYAKMDATKLHMPCRADYGGVMKPFNILNGYDGANYQNATEFVISFYLATADEEQRAMADAWNDAVMRYLSTCPITDRDTVISFWP